MCEGHVRSVPQPGTGKLCRYRTSALVVQAAPGKGRTEGPACTCVRVRVYVRARACVCDFLSVGGRWFTVLCSHRAFRILMLGPPFVELKSLLREGRVVAAKTSAQGPFLKYCFLARGKTWETEASKFNFFAKAR